MSLVVGAKGGKGWGVFLFFGALLVWRGKERKGSGGKEEEEAIKNPMSGVCP